MAENGRAETTTDPAASRSECRALIVLPRATPDARCDDRPPAAFLTHLIACKIRLPAFRRAGRGEPAAARQSYSRDAARSPRRFNLVV